MTSLSILFGISGSISAYKAPDILRELTKLGHTITPIMTESACEFVTPTSIGVVSQQVPYLDDRPISSGIHHLSITKHADLMVVCPATAHSIAKFAHGLADDLLSQAFLSFTGPKLIVPAMHTEMYENPITQQNIQRLNDVGVHILGPTTGDLACGDTGIGRLVETDVIVKRIQALALDPLPLNGKSIVISAGGTREPIDPVRVLTNRSTGQLGHNLALVASFYGADVTLLSSIPFPYQLDSIRVIDTPTVSRLKDQVLSHSKNCDALYMAAAVSDYTPKTPFSTKLSRQDGLTLQLKETEDILSLASQQKTSHQCFIGFCLDHADQLAEVAPHKLSQKGVDFMVANDPKNIGASHRSFTIYGHQSPPKSYTDCSLVQTSHQLLSLLTP